MKGATILSRPGHRDMVVPGEGMEQRQLFNWAKMVPELSMMYAVPNGGSRHLIEASNLKAEGVKAGVPDIHLPIQCGHLTLYIELKRKAFALPAVGAAKWGTVSSEQLGWLKKLQEYGHYAVICRGCDHAKATITAYLNNDADELTRLNQWWVDLDPEQLRKVTKKPKQARRRLAR